MATQCEPTRTETQCLAGLLGPSAQQQQRSQQQQQQTTTHTTATITTAGTNNIHGFGPAVNMYSAAAAADGVNVPVPHSDSSSSHNQEPYAPNLNRHRERWEQN